MPRQGMGRRARRYQAESARVQAGRAGMEREAVRMDMDSTGGIRADFERLVKRPEPVFDLARAAFVVAAESDPGLDVSACVSQVEHWGNTLRGRIEPGWNNLQKLARLRHYVFEDLAFRGDHEDYYSPENSLLHRVIERRKGVPLTLGILFLELGWRAGIPLEGVGFPGNFLVRLTGEEQDLLLDPFRDGRSVHEEDCRRMIDEMSGGRMEFRGEHLHSVTK